MLRMVTLSGLVSCAAVRPASALWINHADGTYTYIPSGMVLVLVLAVSSLVAAAYVSTMNSFPRSREKTADEYNAEATMLAAQRRRMEMETELRKAEIEAARIDALHQEISDIVTHDKKIRNLNAKLEEIRRRS
jgi:Zn-dependent protease with chaperone function